MKLIIQIPCWNEAQTLPQTIAGLPRQVEGFDTVEILVIDDGSTDGTATVARALGVDHIIRLNGHQGLARAFMAGLAAATDRGADVIVNTDADNQFDARDLPALVQPILEGRADLVIGARPIQIIRYFSPLKRFLHRLGNQVIRALSSAAVADAPCGFRALTRDAALRLNVFGDFTYTLETIIQAHWSNLRLVSVPIRVNAPTRPSRLFRSNLGCVWRALGSVVNAYVIYRPIRIFSLLALGFFIPGIALVLCYLCLWMTGEGTGHVKLVLAAAVLALCAVFLGAVGIIAHLQSINRRLLEELRYLARARRFQERLLVDHEESEPVGEVQSCAFQKHQALDPASH
ncbi:MAG TPA: glycosyltransferase family 2 protein [Gemmataceae bacterium]|nr:glycosyltransferase family 2 protein [Gemmataceae bacterium]